MLKRPWKWQSERTIVPRDQTRKRDVTVCIAALFKWNYAPLGSPLDLGSGIIALSDRMITAADIQYEPAQTKVAHITPNIMILIAGDYSLHSQAIINTDQQVRGNAKATTHNVAQIYASQIQAIRRKEAEDRILAPLGLNTDTFLAQQSEMSDGFVNALTIQLQEYQGSAVEALVVGTEDRLAHIYQIDHYGTVRCYDDVGFAAIGFGAAHASSILMQRGYINNSALATALTLTFAAKKAAEVAPGVGRSTDIHIILKDAKFPLWDHMAQKLEEIHCEYQKKRDGLTDESVATLQGFLNEPEAHQNAARSSSGEASESFRNRSEERSGDLEGIDDITDEDDGD